MVEDDPQGNKNKQRRRRSVSGASSGGPNLGGGLGSIVGMVLPYLIKKPKLLIILAVVGIGGYLLFGKGCSQQAGAGDVVSNLFQRGSVLDKEVYEQSEIYEPLADNVKNPLPEKTSLLKYAPRRLNQGKQGSCVAWASAYAGRTILESQRTGKNPNSVRFSPSFMYNQISIDHSTCQGSYIKLAMDNMMEQGAVPFNDFKYDDDNCTKEPSRSLKDQANEFKIKGFQRLTDDKHSRIQEMLAIKQNLAQGSPVIIGMMVGGTFMSDMVGRDTWIPTNNDYSQRGFGGHAMCVIGYDDYKEGGSFQIMNSWGEDWGNKGIFWIRYTDFREFNMESYGLYPMGDASDKLQAKFTGSFGLNKMDKTDHSKVVQSIDLKRVRDNYFETSSYITTNDKFKVEFTNNVECYTYIFGQELDGTSYVLFPYTEKHSPYCGITGTRLFPRDFSMQSDGKGESIDKISVVISKKPLDYNELNNKISKINGSDYESKVNTALQEYNSRTNYSIRNDGVVSFSSSNSEELIHFVIGVKVK